MSTDPDTILLEAEEAMAKAIDYLDHEMRGMRTGRASPALVEYIKVEYYGSPTDLKQIAAVSVPEATQLLIKPFDATSVSDIRKALEASDLGLNPQVEGKQIRLNIPPLSRERRQQLVGHVKKMGEEQKVVVRNARRDANKHAEALAKDKDAHFPEDELKTLKDEIQELTKKYEGMIDTKIDAKSTEVMEI
ncbi:MAG: ribosome recycling factor [Phycisphaeraceae bacterium]|nr:ribosome recycling factor [Phycisphaerales bacterium]MCB9860960.1 ribosome recycling factor [Phycisphaeraceae bacterium]